MDIQEISDRLEIQSILAAYCDAIDTRDFQALDQMFTADATVDYTEAGGGQGSIKHTKAYLVRALEQFSGMQHMLGLPVIKIEGDAATSRTPVFNPMVVDREDGPKTFFIGLWYRDEWLRTDTGWRIKSRYEDVSYFHNIPADFVPVEP